MFLSNSLPDKFWAKCQPEPNSGCWLWTAAHNPQDYGLFWWNGRLKTSHQVAYTCLVGEVKPGLELDHKCRNTRCCNPHHLEPVTHAVNMARGKSAMRTKCKHGHPYAPGNLGKTRVGRRCLRCHAASQLKYKNLKPAREEE